MSEIVFTCAFPAAGKSSLVEKFPGHDRLNRDTVGGSLADIAAELDKRLLTAKHDKFILDNTYATKAHREALVKVAKKHKVALRCIWLDTSIEDCMVNACHRMVRKFGHLPTSEEMVAANKAGDSNTFPIAILYKFRKEFEEPTEAEGFKLEVLPFVRKGNSEFKKKAIFLDYDGTLRDVKPGATYKYPVKKDDIAILPGRKEKLLAMEKEGYILLGVSNQSGIAKGHLTAEMARELFAHTNKLLGINIDVSFCPHKVPPISCFCRKPGPGIGIEFIEKYKLDPAQCIMVGDMATDKSFAGRCNFKFVDQSVFFK